MSIRIGGRTLETSAVFDAYWTFAAERQAILYRRLANDLVLTDDPILRAYRFTNPYRATDRVSQYLIRDVIYANDAPADAADVAFRILLFKIFNRVETWEGLVGRLGQISWATYDRGAFIAALDELADRGPIYSNAYVMPSPKLGMATKRENHLLLLEHLMFDGFADRVARSQSLESVYNALIQYPGIGPFLAYQYAIDLNYSPILDATENEFVVAGPGAIDGIRKCFGRESAGLEAEIIAYMAGSQSEHFSRLGLEFVRPAGRPLQLIDCQNLFCEVDKYARVAFPEIAGRSGRSRIKQRFVANLKPLTLFFPPKWASADPD